MESTSSHTKPGLGAWLVAGVLIIAFFIGGFWLFGQVSSLSPIQTPDVVNLSLTHAKEKINEAGIDVDKVAVDTKLRSVSEVDQLWAVCWQSPNAGVEIKKDATVSMIVAKDCGIFDEKLELMTYRLPSMVGLVVSDAMETIEDISEYATITKEDATGLQRPITDENNWVVCAQSPEAGQEISVEFDLDITYASNLAECYGESVEGEESPAEQEATESGLTAADARVFCNQYLESKYPNLIGKWFDDVRLANISNEEAGGEWNFVVGVTEVEGSNDNLEKTFVCKVGGDPENLRIIEGVVND